MQNIPKELDALAAYKQFILWRIETRDDKPVKVPISPYTLTRCDPHDPTVWVDGPTATATASTSGAEYGVGFVFTLDDPFFFVDIDHCLQDDNTWSSIALELMALFPGAAIEVSQSGTGLHIFGKGQPIPHRCKNTPLQIEYYTASRFVALTGTNIVGDAGIDYTAQLHQLTEKYFPFNGVSDVELKLSDGPVENWTGPIDDEKLLEKALKSKSTAGMLGGRATFSDLWTGDAVNLGHFFPEINEKDPFDRSSADAALASHLAFWTGKDGERIARLMRLSGLMRDKYDRKGDDYLVRTIANACAYCHDVLGASIEADAPVAGIALEQPVALAELPKVELKQGFQFLAGHAQAEFFKGCVYIRSLHRVLIPSGEILKPEQFRATYGGYLFALDAEGEKTTKNAFEAFTESQAVNYPQAALPCFRPDLSPGALFYDEGLLNVNTYFPAHIRSVPGDAEPFLTHIAKLLPNENDRAIMLAYMAACVQHKGVKFQWCPLVQGAPGNGKTLLTRVVREAIGRKFCHMPKAQDLDNKFNGWMLNKILIGVEDIYIPEHRAEIIEALKPMITGGDGLEIQFKGADQFTADVCANFILNSNHKDAIRKDENDRRFSVFYTAQQSNEEIEASGMGGDYFPKIYAWLRGDGYAIVANYLENYEIPYALNPAGGCIRAPSTSSTIEAVAASTGRVEAEIMEAIDEGRYGFAGGWVSSMMLDKLLEHTRSTRAVSRNKRREVMKTLGYDYHPNLTGGRVNSNIPAEEGKPRLYIREGHLAHELTTSALIVAAYQQAQGAPANGSHVAALSK